MGQRSVSIVIANFNGAQLLKENIPSVIQAANRSKLDFEIIVPDDHSSDHSLTLLQGSFPEVRVIPSQENMGFSININKGLKAATKDLVLALNSDVSLTPDYFESLLPLFDDPKLFGVTGLMKDPNTNEVTDAAKVHTRCWSGEIRATKNVMPGTSVPFPTFYLSGASALIDRKKLAEVGYFNEIFSPFYGEDTDLGLTAWRAGWICLCDPRAIAYHKTSSTIMTFNKKARIRLISRRNKFLFHEIHLQGWEKLLYRIKLALDVLTRWVGLDFSFYRAFFQYLAKRSELQKNRRPIEARLIPTRPTLNRILQLQNFQENRSRLF